MSYEVKGDRVMENMRFAAIPICYRHLRRVSSIAISIAIAIWIKIKNNPQPTTHNQHPRSYERGYHLTTQLFHLPTFPTSTFWCRTLRVGFIDENGDLTRSAYVLHWNHESNSHSSRTLGPRDEGALGNGAQIDRDEPYRCCSNALSPDSPKRRISD